MRTANILKLAPLLLLLLPSVPGRPDADEIGQEDWTVITCDGNLLMEHDAQKATFSRNVRVVNPRGSISADRLVIFFCREGETVDRLEAFGSVELDLAGRTGGADTLAYHPRERRLVLLANARVRIGADTVRGEKITFYLDRDEMEVEAATDMRIVPPREWRE